MKNRKVVIVTFIIVLVLLLGIGYAITDKTLTISGNVTASADDANFKVKFDNTVTPTATGDGTASGSITNDLTAVITVSGLTTVGQKATVTYTIKNESPDLKANLTATPSITNSEYFNVTYKFAGDASTTTVNAGGNTTIAVTVELVKAPLEEVSGTATVTITAQAAQ